MLVEASDISKELMRVWESLEGTNKMRASMFNLVLYTQKTSRDAYLRSVAEKVIEQFPCRILFVSVDDAAGKGFLKAAVSLVFAGKEGSDVACDLIQLEVAKDQITRIPFVILPHILPDLPIYLVWEEDPSLKNPIFDQMKRSASRIIFDSESSYDLPSFAKKLLSLYQEEQIDVADLNWARMENWRHLFTTHFYSLENLEKLQKVDSVRIYYNSHKTASFCHTRIQAVYLQAWLSCQLQWQLVQTEREGNDLIFTYKNKEGEVVIRLTPEEDAELAPGIITSVNLATTHAHRYSFKRHEEVPNHIVIHMHTPEACEVPTHHIFVKGGSGGSLVKEVCHRGTSEHYLKVLQFVSQMESVC